MTQVEHIMRMRLCNTTIDEMEGYLKALRDVGCNGETVLRTKIICDIEVPIK